MMPKTFPKRLIINNSLSLNEFRIVTICENFTFKTLLILWCCFHTNKNFCYINYTCGSICKCLKSIYLLTYVLEVVVYIAHLIVSLLSGYLLQFQLLHCFLYYLHHNFACLLLLHHPVILSILYYHCTRH